MITRRTFALASAASAASLSAKPFPKPLGVQLYTARTVLPNAPEATLKRIAEIGYKEIELYDVKQLDTWLPIATNVGLKATSMHIGAQVSLAADDGAYKTALEKSKKAGLSYVGVPYVAPNERGQGEFWKAYAGKLNKAAETAKGFGLGFFYHHHAFEFAGEKGTRPIDYFDKELDKKLVKLELDVFWAAAAGQDPVALLNSWKGRIALMHVKDKASSMGVIENERQAKKEDFKEVGNGNLNFSAILSTALKTGVDKFYVEQDQTPGDPLASLQVSFDNLKKISV